MKLILFTCMLATALAMRHTSMIKEKYDTHWELFKQKHEKSYMNHDEEVLRRYIWEENLEVIQEHNIRADLGEVSFWLGVTEYADMTAQEHADMRNGLIPNAKREKNFKSQVDGKPLAQTVDWRTSGCVTPVKNQKQCGSCWAFSATGSLEGQLCLKSGGNKTLVSLSEQNLVDCSKAEGNMGCKGGLMDQGFTYIKKNNGIDTEKCYPYEGRDGTCRFKKNCVGGTCTGFVDIPSKSETELQAAVSKVGPVSVAIDASSILFQLYRRGVFNHPGCSETALDHGVLAVGYGTESGKDYWLVKNSWGSSWGEAGYIKMSRNKNNQCGIATQASYPTV